MLVTQWQSGGFTHRKFQVQVLAGIPRGGTPAVVSPMLVTQWQSGGFTHRKFQVQVLASIGPAGRGNPRLGPLPLGPGVLVRDLRPKGPLRDLGPRGPCEAQGPLRALSSDPRGWGQKTTLSKTPPKLGVYPPDFAPQFLKTPSFWAPTLPILRGLFWDENPWGGDGNRPWPPRALRALPRARPKTSGSPRGRGGPPPLWGRRAEGRAGCTRGLGAGAGSLFDSSEAERPAVNGMVPGSNPG